MTEKESEKVKAKEKIRVEKRTGKLLSSFVVLTIVLSVLAVSISSVSARDFDGIIVTASPSTIYADGSSTSTITATLTMGGVSVAKQDCGVSFVFVGDPKGTFLDPTGILTDENGEANTTLTAGLETGVVTIMAITAGTPDNPSVEDDIQVTLSGAPEVTSIVVSPSEATLIVGGTQQFTATAYDQYSGVMPDVEFTWTRSNGTVGTVNGTGFFEALALGNTLVNATNASIVGSASVTVTVYAPDLIVTGITLNCDEIFGNESNDINATIKNVGTEAAGAFNVNFTVDAFSDVVSVSGLDVGASKEVTITDPTLRTAGDSVTITVTIDLGGKSNSTTVTVMNNGYKNKSFMGMDSLELFEYDAEMYGGVVYNVSGTKDWKFEPGENQTRIHHIDIPAGMEVKKARLYVYWYDYFYNIPPGCLANLSVNFSGTTFTAPDVAYTDQKGFGDWNTPKGTYAYNVTSLVSGSADYTVVVENVDPLNNTAILGEMLLVVYEDPAEEPGNRIQLWMLEGNDLLLGGDKYCASTEEATATVAFPGTIEDLSNKSATLISVVAQGMEPGANMIFNGTVIKPDAWDSSTEAYPDSKINVESVDVRANLGTSSNNMGFQDTGTTGMQASNAILVVGEVPPVTEYNITIYTGWNMIAIPLMPANTSLNATIIGAVDYDTIYRWVTGAGYKSAEYYAGTWYGDVSDVEPIEPEVGYWFDRKGSDYNLTITGVPLTGTIIETPIYTGWNLVGYASLTETDLSVINDPVDYDTIYRWIPGVGYKSAEYYGGTWYGDVSDVEPIEPGVGYWFERKGSDYIWTYTA